MSEGALKVKPEAPTRDQPFYTPGKEIENYRTVSRRTIEISSGCRYCDAWQPVP